MRASAGKAANQVKFYITLECTTGRVTESYSAQMVWRFNPNGICSEFAEDWTRIAKHPFLISSVSRESVSKKGKLQAIDLSDVATLMPVFRQDRGSLVGPHTSHRDLAVLIPRAIETALHDRRIVPDGQAALCEAWERFRCSYETAVTECFAEGVSSPACSELESTYSHLLESLIHHAPGDGNRKHLWEPILQLGIAVVEGTPPAAIVAPWHPLRLCGTAVKVRQACGLVNYLLTAETVDFGDARLFFDDLSEEKILEGSENDADSFVASEASRDFMARLRIGIMADSAPIPSAQDGPPIDIVFLQDVIARLADPVWLTEPNDAQVPEMLHHVPPRCSRRRPGTIDDLRSVMYLTSPVQPAVGWRYLQAVYSVMQSVDIDPALRPVPARQISFQNNLTRTIFDEVHRLGQWVVNYDDLLTRRQLRNQGVQIIRYRQHPHGGRNMTISSRAPLNLLEVLVQRRLFSLNLDLDTNELRDLTRPTGRGRQHDLRRYSHVFVHSQESSASDPSERVPLANVDHAWQEIYDRDHFRQLVLAYHRHESPRPIRAAIGDDAPWGVGTPTPPSARVIWTAVPRTTQVQPTGMRTDTVPAALSPTAAVPSAPPSRPRGRTPVAAPPSPSTPLPPAAIALVREIDPIQPSLSDQPDVVPSADFAWAGANVQRVLSGLTPSESVPAEDQSWLAMEVSRLRAALLSYGLQTRILGSRLTPNAALVRLQGSDRLRVSDIESRREELLTTHGLNITNVLAEPGQVVVSVARPHRQVVNLIDVWRNRCLDSSRERSNQMLVVGVRESNGETLYLCPQEAHAPHTLIAGTTGSGKSILIQMVSNTVQRLGVMARAAGIFLIFAAQHPEDRVMPLQLRDNLGNRLVLRVESPGTSKIALGEEGAKRLLGKGHLAARLSSEDRIILAQVPILTPEQIRAIVATISSCTPGTIANLSRTSNGPIALRQ
ncbi:MAG: hypothetical protein ACLQNE_38310 [Thermoguttaceae bacterium]